MKTDKASQSGFVRRYVILLLIWSALLGGSLLWAMHQETRNTLDVANAAARANISKDIGFRRWATSHGGVYVPPTEHTPPNPYLKVPNRDVVTTDGKELTLMNPAYMLREMQTDFSNEYGTKSHITSLKLLNPNNAPDVWEAGALRAFDQGEKERVELQQIDGQPYLRMMRPLITESGCLKCHAFQGYKVGDVRGGISTSISLAPYLAREHELKNSLALTHGAIWLIGLAGLGFSYRSDRRQAAEREKAANKLRESEEKSSAISAAVPDGLIMVDDSSALVYWNHGAEQILGYRADEALGKQLHLLLTPQRYQSAAIQGFNAFRTTGQGAVVGKTIEIEALHKDGREIPVELSISALRLNDRWHAVGILRDIAARKKTEFVLRQNAEVLKEAQRIAHLGSWHMDLATNEVYWSEELYRLYGFDPALPPPLYTESMKLFTPESWEKLSSAIARATETGIPYELELETVNRDGGRGWMLARGELVRDERGAAVGVRGVVMDITVRKQAEEELKEREKHSQSLLRLARRLESAQAYSEVLDAAQDEVKSIIGYQNVWAYLFSDDKSFARAIFAGGPISDTVMSEEGTATLGVKGDRMMEEIAQAQEIVLVADAQTDERVNKEIVNRLQNRTIVNVPIILSDRHMGSVGMGTFGEEGVRIPSASEQKYLMALASHMAAALDRLHLLAERKKAETELRELNNDFVTLLESTGDFIYFKDKDGRIRFCSQTLATITGHHNWREMIGKHDHEIFPKDTARIYYEEELPIFREGKPLLNKTDPYYDAQGKKGWVNTNKWPVFGEDNKTVVGIFGISRDVTELKVAEDKINELNRDLEKRVEERTMQLEAANKELEAFSYSVSHDLRAPLRAIDGFSHILLEDYADKLDAESKRLLNVVRENTNRMGQLIDDILKFSRAGRLDINFTEIDMEQMARAVVEELHPSVADGKLQIEIEHLPRARGDGAMMHQVFVNLLSNAIKFTRNTTPAKIRVGCSIEGDAVVYYVKDNGAGFDMQYADKLFGVFQRLHGVSEYEGTGIGLAIVKRIITRHGGRVWAEGKVNEGATIYFALPRAELLSE